jgi:hypothetical protein
LGINAVELPHPPTEIRIRCFQQKMVVVTHEAIGVAEPSVAIGGLAKYLQKRQTIAILQKHTLAAVSTRGYVIDGTWIFHPQWPCHSSPPGSINKSKRIVTVNPSKAQGV